MRTFWIVLLSIGVLASFAAGFARLRHGPWRYGQRQAAFEKHVADLCVDAARRWEAQHAPSPP